MENKPPRWCTRVFRRRGKANAVQSKGLTRGLAMTAIASVKMVVGLFQLSQLSRVQGERHACVQIGDASRGPHVRIQREF